MQSSGGCWLSRASWSTHARRREDQGRIEVALLLLARGAAPDDLEGNTLLHLAAAGGSVARLCEQAPALCASVSAPSPRR